MGIPYTGHTTMADVLVVGVPGVTLMGEGFASRVAGSLRRNLGMEELVTEERTSYERLAVEWATDSGRLAGIGARDCRVIRALTRQWGPGRRGS